MVLERPRPFDEGGRGRDITQMDEGKEKKREVRCKKQSNHLFKTLYAGGTTTTFMRPMSNVMNSTEQLNGLKRVMDGIKRKVRDSC